MCSCAGSTTQGTTSQSSTASDAAVPRTLTTGTTLLSTTATTSVGTTTGKCAEMQAVDYAVSRQIITTPTHLSADQTVEFQPTSKTGVSFPQEDKNPTIFVNFQTPALVQSVAIPRSKTPNANVQQFDVTFYSPNGTKISQSTSTPSPTDDSTKPAQLDSSKIPSETPVSRIEIRILSTTDNGSPKGVILDIKACTSARIGKCC